MRKFLTGMVIALLLVAVVTAVAFGYLYFNNQAALSQARQDKLNADLQVSGLQQTVQELSGKRTFSDAKLGMTVTYPFDWQINISTDISTQFTNIGDTYGPLVTGYNWNLTKDEAKLTFRKIFGGVGGRGLYLDPANYTYKVLSSDKGDVIRFKANDGNEWFYVTRDNCSDFEEANGKADAVCTGILFGKSDNLNLPTGVTLSGKTDDALLAEADAIVLSAEK